MFKQLTEEELEALHVFALRDLERRFQQEDDDPVDADGLPDDYVYVN